MGIEKRKQTNKKYEEKISYYFKKHYTDIAERNAKEVKIGKVKGKG